MRLLIGIFIASMAAIVCYDLGLRLPLDIQFGILGLLSLVFWALLGTFSDDEHAHH